MAFLRVRSASDAAVQERPLLVFTHSKRRSSAHARPGNLCVGEKSELVLIQDFLSCDF